MNLLEETTGITSIPQGLDSIAFNQKGQLALAASNLTGKTWNGVISVFNDPKFAPNIPHVEYGCINEAGCTDIDWLNCETIVVGTDAGTIEVWKLKNAPCIENEIVLSEHNDVCSSISISQKSKQILSSSWDSSIKVWDLGADMSVNTICFHTDKVLQVAWENIKGDEFVSVSEDGSVKIFDNRSLEKPAILLSFDKTCYPTCVSWKNDKEIHAGYCDGKVKLFDVRSPNTEVRSERLHRKCVNDILCNEKLMITASDDMSLKLHSLKNWECLYEDKTHSDYIQSVSMNEKVVWSCGWDGLVLKHEIL